MDDPPAVISAQVRPTGRRICLLTSAHLSYNPRLLKEADALAEAGHRVRVVSLDLEPLKREWDRRLMATRTWEHMPLHVTRPRWLIAGTRQKVLERHPRLWRGACEDLAFSRYLPLLTKLASSRPADLFIAHTLQALPAAHRAARAQGAKLGFDAEDFHRGELPDVPETALTRTLVARIERKYIPLCDYVSAASAGISRAYAERLQIAPPRVILNAFPLIQRSGTTPASELAQERRAEGLSLYWYSQVIGAGRGLPDAVNALALLRGNAHLHLRGIWADGFRSELMGLAQRLGVDRRIHVLPSVPPEQLVERSAQHDVGLAGEMGHTENGKLAVSNKLLTYLLAGVAVAASDVPAQREILAASPEAGFLYPPGAPRTLAAGLQVWLDNPVALERAKDASRRLGESRFCWELEKEKLLDGINELLRA